MCPVRVGKQVASGLEDLNPSRRPGKPVELPLKFIDVVLVRRGVHVTGSHEPRETQKNHLCFPNGLIDECR